MRNAHFMVIVLRLGVIKMSERLHRILLDYDGMTKEAVEQEAERLKGMFPELGDYRIEPSNTSVICWTLRFPKSAVTWQKAAEVVEASDSDCEWKKYVLRYRCMTKRTEISMGSEMNPPREVRNLPVKEITLPVKITILAESPLDLKRLVKLCEAINDKTWEWKVETPLWDLETRVIIGCVDKQQAERRVRMIGEIGIGTRGEITW